jgi:predicted transcriptional regulator
MAKRSGKPTYPLDEQNEIHKLVLRVLARFDGNMTRMGLALGLSQPTVSDWVSQKNTPHHKNVRAMRHLLGEKEAAVRAIVEASQADPFDAMTMAWHYWRSQNRWPDEVLTRARALAENGAVHDPQGWTIRMDELANQVTKRSPKR